jgi:hypothetical protein
MVLRLDNRGELGWYVCGVLFLVMLAIVALCVLGAIATAQSTPLPNQVSAGSFFAPSHNRLGFLWVLTLAVMLLGVPLYISRTYHSALIFRFSRTEDQFYRGRQRVCRLGRIEELSIREDKDPDARYLYLLRLIFNDGQEMLLFNGYSERDVLNLANEISSYLLVPTVWRQGVRRP